MEKHFSWSNVDQRALVKPELRIPGLTEKRKLPDVIVKRAYGHFPFRLIIKMVSMSMQEHRPLIKDCITLLVRRAETQCHWLRGTVCVSVCVHRYRYILSWGYFFGLICRLLSFDGGWAVSRAARAARGWSRDPDRQGSTHNHLQWIKSSLCCNSVSFSFKSWTGLVKYVGVMNQYIDCKSIIIETWW